MPVRINEINVRNLGPIQAFSLKLGQLNLIYGKNEQGKTYLVEFLLRSLFKAGKKWQLRDQVGDGKVTVEGLSDQAIEFTPAPRKKKLEDYLLEASPGLPMDLSKLLVVKGAELEFVRDRPGGVNRAVLKEYLSSEAVLDQILKSIKSNEQNATVEDGRIVGKDTGEIARQREVRAKLQKCDDLLGDVDQADTGGHRTSLQRRLQELQTSIDRMESARRFAAHSLTEEIEGLEAGKAGLSRDGLTAFRALAINVSSLQQTLEGTRANLQGVRETSDRYAWLDQALHEYKSIVDSLRRKPSRALVYLGSLFLLGAISAILFLAFELLTLPLAAGISGGSLILMGLFFVWYMISQSKSERAVFATEEYQKIKAEFEAEFNSELPSLAKLEELHDALQKDDIRRQQLEGDIRDAEAQLVQREMELTNHLSRFDFSGEEHLDSWTDRIDVLEQRLDTAERAISQRRELRASLGVDPSDYLNEDPGVVFQKSTLDEFKAEHISTQAEIDQADRSLADLRLKITTFLELQDTLPDLDELIARLRDKRQELAQEYRKKTAILLAKILVKDELEVIRGQEDLKIQEVLGSKEILRPLQEITGHYNGIQLEQDQLILADSYTARIHWRN